MHCKRKERDFLREGAPHFEQFDLGIEDRCTKGTATVASSLSLHRCEKDDENEDTLLEIISILV